MTSIRRDQRGPIVEVKCACRTWPVFILFPIGRCGYCKVRPTRG